MQRTLIASAVLVSALMVGGCSSGSFMVYKDGRNFYVTSDCAERKRTVCDSGDIDRVVRDSNLPAPLQMELKNGICPVGKAANSVQATLDRMTDEQRAALKGAFRKNGYEINKVADS